MKVEKLIEHFGTRRKMAVYFDVSVQATYYWDKIVPESRAYRFLHHEGDVVPIDADDYKPKE